MFSGLSPDYFFTFQRSGSFSTESTLGTGSVESIVKLSEIQSRRMTFSVLCEFVFRDEYGDR